MRAGKLALSMGFNHGASEKQDLRLDVKPRRRRPVDLRPWRMTLVIADNIHA
jgi:hypothetical protein